MRSLSTAWNHARSKGYGARPEHLRGGGILIPVKIGAMKINALVDTGSDTSIIDIEKANKENIKLKETVDGSSTASNIKIIRYYPIIISIGTSKFSINLSGSDFKPFVGEKDLGLIIGMDVLKNCVIQMDYNMNMFQISPKPLTPPSKTFLPLKRVPGKSGRAVQFLWPDGGTTYAQLDTGNDGALSINWTEWLKHKPKNYTPTSSQKNFLTGVAEVGLAGVSGLRLGDSELPRFDVEIINSNIVYDLSVLGIMGMGILKCSSFQIDFQADRLYFSDRHDCPRLQHEGAGLGFSFGKQGLVVTNVMRHSPAEAAGFIAGEEVCEINGQAITRNYRSEPVSAWQKQPKGTKASLRLCSGERREIVLDDFY